MKGIDCRGLPCPQPVINTKNLLDEVSEGEIIYVLVDNEAAVTNVSRFAEAQGHEIEILKEGSHWRLQITKKGPGVPVTNISCDMPEGRRPVVVIDRLGMGQGDEDLSRILIKAFIKTLKEATSKPSFIIFYNQGIFLTLDDSEFIEDLKALEALGIKILVCGTCLDFYKVKDRLAVGQISNMYDIMETMLKGNPVIKP